MIRLIHSLPVCALLLAANGSGWCDGTPVAPPEPAFRSLHESLRAAARAGVLPEALLARADSLEERHTERLRALDARLEGMKSRLPGASDGTTLLDSLIAAIVERENLRHAGLDSLRSLAGLLHDADTLYNNQAEPGLQLRWEPEDLSGSVEDP